VRFPALVVAVDREEVGPDGRAATARFAEETGVPVHPVVTMTEVLDHLGATNRLPDDARVRCAAYLAQYGTEPARRWAERAATSRSA
jgi:orotate phosphoribosyltransferase